MSEVVLFFVTDLGVCFLFMFMVLSSSVIAAILTRHDNSTPVRDELADEYSDWARLPHNDSRR